MIGTPEKSSYEVPRLAMLQAGYELYPSLLKSVSLFSGAGGSCLGLRWAGFETLWASEFVGVARATYAANYPGVTIDDRDVRDVEPEEILEATGLVAGELDLLEGSPPCASFSSAGSGVGIAEERAYSGRRQRTDDLFFEYVRLLRGLRPKVFVAENVRGLVEGKSTGYFREIFEELAACGYHVEARVLDAQWLGVPQHRERLFFVGVREDLSVEPRFPDPLPYRYTVRDVLDVYELIHDPRGNAYRTPATFSHRPAPTITVAGNSAMAWQLFAVDVAGGSRRRLTIAELLRLSGFPDDFVLVGSFVEQWERVARAVPPVMMYHVGLALRSILVRR